MIGPFSREFFNTSDVATELIKKKPTKIKDDVFFLPLLTKSTCEKILEEMARWAILSFSLVLTTQKWKLHIFFLRFHSSMLPSSPPTPPHTKVSKIQNQKNMYLYICLQGLQCKQKRKKWKPLYGKIMAKTAISWPIFDIFHRLYIQGYFLYELGMDLLVESLRHRLDQVAR